ncbi:MAG: glutamine synthetase, partial [Candidatus Aenigmarchaeota archaeon]|nr:glutamine synthetase [Candidatus Aenigmarchaeota archaeon]
MKNDINGTVIERARKDDVKFVNLWFTDFFGTIKSTTIPVEKLEEGLNRGIWFDGSSIEGFARIHESDMILMPDPSTYAILPWRPRQKAVARIICDIHTPEGKPFEGDPRYILKRAIAEARDIGFVYNTGPECEFFLFKINGEPTMEPVTHDFAGYFDFAPRDLASDVRRKIVFALEEMGLEIEMDHHEVAPGQHEIDFKYADALTTADNTITLKAATKAIAHSMDLHATFMPKPIFGQNGSGMHVNQSLFTLDGNTAFFSKNDKYNISETAKHFIAGQLKHVREIAAVIDPTVNSYKRLVSGYEAPVYVCWANINRSSLIRIPRYSPGREQSVRVELRCPDPSCNPYLAFAAMLRAGIHGIKDKTPLPAPVEEDVYNFSDEKLVQLNIGKLPSSLKEAIDEFSRSELMKDTFGKNTFN